MAKRLSVESWAMAAGAMAMAPIRASVEWMRFMGDLQFRSCSRGPVPHRRGHAIGACLNRTWSGGSSGGRGFTDVFAASTRQGGCLALRRAAAHNRDLSCMAGPHMAELKE